MAQSHSEGVQQLAEAADVNYREIDVLQKEFQQILNDLADDQSLLRFRHEYQRLYRALKRSHENQKILYNKITELNRDMANQTAKIRVALKLSQEDSQAISFLKQQLEKACKVLEVSKEREERSKQKIQNLNLKIKLLQGNLEQRQAQSQGQSQALKQLQEQQEELVKNKTELNTELHKIKAELSEHYEKLRVNDNQRAVLENSIRQVSKQLGQVEQKLRKDEGRKVKIQDELNNLDKQRQMTTVETKKHVEEFKKLQQSLLKKATEIDTRKAEEEALRLDNEEKQTKIRALKAQYIEQTQQKQHIHHEVNTLQKSIQSLKKILNNIIANNSQNQKTNDKLRNQEVQAKQALIKVERENDVLLNSVTQLERQIADRRKLNSQDQDELEQLSRYCNILMKELNKVEGQCKIHNEKLTKKQKEIQLLQLKITETNETLGVLKKDVDTLEKEKEKYGKQAAQSNAKYLASLQEIKLKGNLISEYQKKNLQTETRLKQQQRLYEAVRSDRNTYSKNLSQTEDQIAQIKRRYKIVNHQISQLKEQIDAKEITLAKERIQHKKKDKTIEEHSRLLEKHRKEIAEYEQKIKSFHGQTLKLHSIIKQSEDQRKTKKQQYELIVAERDIFGTQLIRRNDESALLFEKIKIQQATLGKGETAYRERLADLKLLEYKKNDLKRELKLIMKMASKIPELKNQIYNLNDELYEEKLKVKALSEQLENPLNAQRIRQLEGNDPDEHEMKEKIKKLQKRLIFKTEQVVQKQVLIHQKEKQIMELREIMNRQPQLKEAQRISALQRLLNSKTRQMKALASEINMYQAQTNVYKYDIEKVTKEIEEIKRKYNEQRRREQLAKENERLLQQA